MRQKHESSRNLKNGASNRGSDGRFLPGYHWRESQQFRDRDFLVTEYLDKHRSAAEIAVQFRVTDGAILYWLCKHEIRRRTTTEARQVKKWVVRGSANGMSGRCGAKNPRWIDGSSPERQRLYAQTFWKELIRVVYARDDYKCQRCRAGHTQKNRLHAHHIKPWAGNQDARFDLENIKTLCGACHAWVHSKQNVSHEYILP